jgi:sugar lactone lactonase YvrE
VTAAEQVTGPVAHHGEGPIWDEQAGAVRWVDMLAGDVLALDRSGAVSRRHVAAVVAALRPRRAGGFVLAVERGFALASADLREVRALPEVWDDPMVRMNDGGCDPQGRFYCGTMAYDATPGAGRLYQLDAQRRVRVALDDVTVSNGLVWSPDGQKVYYVDTATQRVDTFDFDPRDGAFHDRRIVVEIEPALGGPDGMAIDAEGGLWVALWDGAAVHRYTMDGQLDAVLDLPTPRVTACTFGGPDLADLYITTSRLGLDDSDPAAGALFVARPGVRGELPLAYAG